MTAVLQFFFLRVLYQSEKNLCYDIACIKVASVGKVFVVLLACLLHRLKLSVVCLVTTVEQLTLYTLSIYRKSVNYSCLTVVHCVGSGLQGSVSGTDS